MYDISIGLHKKKTSHILLEYVGYVNASSFSPLTKLTSFRVLSPQAVKLTNRICDDRDSTIPCLPIHEFREAVYAGCIPPQRNWG